MFPIWWFTLAKPAAGQGKLMDNNAALPVPASGLKYGAKKTPINTAPKNPVMIRSFGPNAQTSTAPKNGATISLKQLPRPIDAGANGSKPATLPRSSYEKFTRPMLVNARIATPTFQNRVSTL